MTDSLRVAALTGSLADPSSRFRVRQFIGPLSRRRIDLDDLINTASRYPPLQRQQRPAWILRSLASGCTRSIRSRGYDVTLLQRELVSTIPTFEWLTGSPRVLDVDDAIHLKQRAAATRLIAHRCDAVMCGNENLADYYGNYSRVAIVPTAVDTLRFMPPPERPDGEVLTLGWMGTSSNLSQLDMIASPLRRVLESRPHVRLRVVSDLPDRWALAGHSSVDAVVWSPDSEVEQLQEFDVGLMPLEDTLWNRGKCGFKLLTYLAVGCAAVASPVGVNSDILQHDGDLLPASVREWEDSLIALLDDSVLRRQHGSDGRRHVEERFSVDAVTPLIESVLRSVQ